MLLKSRGLKKLQNLAIISRRFGKNTGYFILCSGLYYKHITIVNDASRVIRMAVKSDATTWSVAYNYN